jgi:hypothetical protein
MMMMMMMVIVKQSVEYELAGETNYSEKICPGVTLSTTNPTLPDPGSNPGSSGGYSVTNLAE